MGSGTQPVVGASRRTVAEGVCDEETLDALLDMAQRGSAIRGETEEGEDGRSVTRWVCRRPKLDPSWRDPYEGGEVYCYLSEAQVRTALRLKLIRWGDSGKQLELVEEDG